MNQSSSDLMSSMDTSIKDVNDLADNQEVNLTGKIVSLESLVNIQKKSGEELTQQDFKLLMQLGSIEV